MAAAALLRSVASKMLSRAAAAPTHHLRSLVSRGLHGGASSGPGVDVIQQGTADVLMSASMAASTGFDPPRCHTHHRPRIILLSTAVGFIAAPLLIRVLPRPNDMATKAAYGVDYIAVFGSAVYMHFWVNPELEEMKAMFQDLRRKSSHLIDSQNMDASSVSHQTPTAPASAGHGNTTDKGTGIIDRLSKEAAVKTMHSQENRVKELEATIMDLKAENAELKIALDSARSQGKA